jgi:hypothetical protein
MYHGLDENKNRAEKETNSESLNQPSIDSAFAITSYKVKALKWCDIQNSFIHGLRFRRFGDNFHHNPRG